MVMNGHNNNNGDDFPSPLLLAELDEHEIFRILKVVQHQQPQQQQQRQQEAPSPPSTLDDDDDVDIRQCHCYQLEKWDCGVACLIMVHRWLNLKLNSSRRERNDQEEDEKNSNDADGEAPNDGCGNERDEGENLVTKAKTSFRTTRPLSPSELWMRTKLLNDDDHMLSEAQDSIWTPDLVWQLHQWRTKTVTEEEEEEDDDDDDDDDDDSSRQEHVQNGALIERFQNLYKKTTQIHKRWLERWRKTTIVNGNSNTVRATFEFLICSNNLESADESYKGYEYYENNFANDSHRVHAIFQLLKEQDDVDMILTTKPPQPTSNTSQTLRENNINTTTTANTSTGQKCDSTTTTTTDQKKRNEHENGTTANNGGYVLPIEAIATVVQHEDCIAIVLLDNNVLTRKAVTNVGTEGRGRSERITPTAPYMGHYVIVCGVSYQEKEVRSSRALDLGVDDYSSEQEDDPHQQPNHEQSTPPPPPPPRPSYCFVVMNPAPSGDPIMYISPQRFEHAWRADGTDEDIIFVRRRRRR